MEFKILRIKAGLTQCELADKLGLKQTTISTWELGKAVPKFKTIKPLAKVLNVTTDELMTALDSGAANNG